MTINQLQTIAITFNNNNTKDISNYSARITNEIQNEINISNYILSLSSREDITSSTILAELNELKDRMIYQLNKLNYKISKISKTILEIDYIVFNFSEYLGHQFFSSIELNIGGQTITKYSPFLHRRFRQRIKKIGTCLD
jgi:hypothetical protein